MLIPAIDNGYMTIYFDIDEYRKPQDKKNLIH
jgi:hypothetical protein